MDIFLKFTFVPLKSQTMEVVSNTVGSYFWTNSLFLYLKRTEVFPVSPSPIMQSFLLMRVPVAVAGLSDMLPGDVMFLSRLTLCC